MTTYCSSMLIRRIWTSSQDVSNSFIGMQPTRYLIFIWLIGIYFHAVVLLATCVQSVYHGNGDAGRKQNLTALSICLDILKIYLVIGIRFLRKKYQRMCEASSFWNIFEWVWLSIFYFWRVFLQFFLNYFDHGLFLAFFKYLRNF